MESKGPVTLILLTIAAIAAAVGVVILFDMLEHLTVFVMVILLFLMAVVPPALRISQGRFDLFEPTMPFGAMNFLYFGAGSLFVLFIPGVAQDASIFAELDLAVTYCTVGYACVLLGYYLAARFVQPRIVEGGARPGWLVIGILYMIGFSGEVTFSVLDRAPVQLGVLISGATSLITQLSFLSTFSLFYMCFMVMSGQASRGQRMLLFGVMLPTQLLGVFLRFGNKTSLFFAIGIPILAYWYAKRKIAWKTLIVIFLVTIFVVFPLYYTVRNYRSEYYSQKYRITRTFESMMKQQAGKFAQGALVTTATRLAIVNSTAAVIRDCGDRVPYKNGETLWLGVISATIPRFLWPNKPNINIGIEFGRTFHITQFGNYSYIAPSQVGELYWNFQLPGVIIGMFLIGSLLWVLYARFGRNRGDPVRLSIYVTLMYAFLYHSGSFLGGLESDLFKEVLVLIALEKLFELMEAIGRSPVQSRVQAPSAIAAR